jgi:hypothetical protein
VKTHTKENHDTHSNAEPSKTHESTPSNEKEVTTKEAEPVKAPTEENNYTPSNAEPSKTLIQSRRENEIGTGDNNKGKRKLDPKEHMEKAKKASIEAVSCLVNCSGINKTPIECTYPEEFADPGHGHLRAIYNIWGLKRVMELVQKSGDIAHEYLSECDVTPIFEKQRHLFEQWHYDSKINGEIFCIKGVRWVTLTPDNFFDDENQYKVTNHDICLDKLKEMTADKPTDGDSSMWKPLLFIIEEKGPLGCTVEPNLKNEAVHITCVNPSSTASKSGLKVGDILCKLGSKGTRFVKKKMKLQFGS